MAEALMKTCLQYGLVAIDEPENYEARANLMWAGTLALNGMLSFGKLPGDWATHMIEHEISAIYDVTHGAGLAIIFPVWMEYVLDADNAWRFAQMARNVWGVSEKDDLTAARQGIEAVRDFFSRLGMPSRLSDLNIDGTHIAVMAKKACVYGDLGNIKKLKIDDVRSILEGAL